MTTPNESDFKLNLPSYLLLNEVQFPVLTLPQIYDLTICYYYFIKEMEYYDSEYSANNPYWFGSKPNLNDIKETEGEYIILPNNRNFDGETMFIWEELLSGSGCIEIAAYFGDVITDYLYCNSNLILKEYYGASYRDIISDCYKNAFERNLKRWVMDSEQNINTPEIESYLSQIESLRLSDEIHDRQTNKFHLILQAQLVKVLERAKAGKGMQQPTNATQTEQIQTEATKKVAEKLPDVIHWSGHDKARFLSKVFPQIEAKQLAKDYWEKLKMKEKQALYGAIKRYENGEIGESNKFVETEGIAAMKVFLGL